MSKELKNLEIKIAQNRGYTTEQISELEKKLAIIAEIIQPKDFKLHFNFREKIAKLKEKQMELEEEIKLNLDSRLTKVIEWIELNINNKEVLQEFFNGTKEIITYEEGDTKIAFKKIKRNKLLDRLLEKLNSKPKIENKEYQLKLRDIITDIIDIMGYPNEAEEVKDIREYLKGIDNDYILIKKASVGSKSDKSKLKDE